MVDSASAARASPTASGIGSRTPAPRYAAAVLAEALPLDRLELGLGDGAAVEKLPGARDLVDGAPGGGNRGDVGIRLALRPVASGPRARPCPCSGAFEFITMAMH